MLKAIVFTVSPNTTHLERAINSVISIRCTGCHLPVFFLTPNAPIKRHSTVRRELNIENVVITVSSPHDQWPSAKSIAPQILMQVEQAIVLDADTICLKDLTRVFDEQRERQFLARPSSRYLHRTGRGKYDWDIFTEIRWQKYLKATGVISEINASLVHTQQEVVRGKITPEEALQRCRTNVNHAPINSGVYLIRRKENDLSIGERLSRKQQELLIRARFGEWCWPYDTGFFTMDEHSLYAAVKLLHLSTGVLPERYHLFGWRLRNNELERMLDQTVVVHTSNEHYGTILSKAMRYLGLNRTDYFPVE